MKYHPARDGEWVPIKWTERLACCGCGLTHRVRYRLRKGSLEVQATILPRSTAMIRRHLRKKNHSFPK